MINLRESSIYDLTSDQELINKIVGFPTSREAYLKLCSYEARVLDMISFAEEILDSKLLAALKAEFSEELARWFNE